MKIAELVPKAFETINDKEYENYFNYFKPKNFKLSNEQLKVLKELNSNTDRFRVHLLQGTTGSGKTIVYFKTIKGK